MSFPIQNISDSASDWIGGTFFVKKLLGNTVFLSLILVALIAVVLASMYHKYFRMMSWKETLRGGIYVLILILIFLAMHDHILVREIRSSENSLGLRTIFSSIHQSQETPVIDSIPVRPELEAENSSI